MPYQQCIENRRWQDKVRFCRLFTVVFSCCILSSVIMYSQNCSCSDGYIILCQLSFLLLLVPNDKIQHSYNESSRLCNLQMNNSFSYFQVLMVVIPLMGLAALSTGIIAACHHPRYIDRLSGSLTDQMTTLLKWVFKQSCQKAYFHKY